MKLDARSLPLLVGAFVIAVGGAFMIGRNLGDARPADISVPAAATTEVAPQHPQQIAAREAIRAGDLGRAAELLEAVPETDPGYLLVLNDLGVVYESLGRAADALATADRLLALQPELPDAYFVRCRALLLLDRYDDAERACLRTLELAPTHTRARFTIGLIRVAQDHLDLAVRAYLRAMDGGRDEQQMLEALGDLTRLEQQRPELAGVHYALAFFANTLSMRERELSELKRYLEMAPEGEAARQAHQRLSALGG